MSYITPEMLEFLAGIRANNSKEWFEPRKPFYQEHVYEPLKSLGAALFAPYAERGDMMHKVARIYKDANYPPFLHYRDTMWIYVRHEAMYWSQTPTLFFEVSPEGARFGFRIASPKPALMAYFREQLSEDPEEFFQLERDLAKHGIAVTGDEYKRPKPCKDERLLPYFKKKSLAAEVALPAGEELFGEGLLPRVQEVFAQVFPLHEYVQGLLTEFELSQVIEEVKTLDAQDEPFMKKAPTQEFMW